MSNVIENIKDKIFKKKRSDNMMKNYPFYIEDEFGKREYITAEYIRKNMDESTFEVFLSKLDEEDLDLFEKYQDSWEFNALELQRVPEEDYQIVLYMGGRGSGKTRAGAEWTIFMICTGEYRNVNIVGPTKKQVEDAMLKGTSGILTIADERGLKYEYIKSDEKIIWWNGVVTKIYTAENPESIRGENSSKFWIDEVAAFTKDPMLVLKNVKLTLRIDKFPNICITTTPKNKDNRVVQDFLRKVVKMKGTILRQLKSESNPGLSEGTIEEWKEMMGDDEFAKQELEGFLSMEDDIQSAIFNEATINKNRVSKIPDNEEEDYTIIAIDPSVSNTSTSDECGIIVATKTKNNKVYIIEDLSGKMSAADWAKKSVNAYYRYNAKYIVAETNNGGDLVKQNITSEDESVEFKSVKAVGNKIQRAAPIGALYERGKVCHIGIFKELEKQMTEYDPDVSVKSPDRMDAVVWAVNELLIANSSNAEAWVDLYKNSYKTTHILSKNKKSATISIDNNQYAESVLKNFEDEMDEEFSAIFK